MFISQKELINDNNLNKEIVDKIESVKNIGEINSWREFQPIPRNPFYF